MASPSVTKFESFIDSLSISNKLKKDIKDAGWVYYIDMVHEYGEHLKFYIQQLKSENPDNPDIVKKADELIIAADKISSGDHPVKQITDSLGG